MSIKRTSVRRRRGLLALLAVGALVTVAACGSSDDGQTTTGALAGVVRDPAPVVNDIVLPDAASDGQPLRLQAEDGLLVVYFGYTSCPDVCPTTMSDLRRALGELQADKATQVDVAMITVDPARDTPEVLTRYVRSFFPDGHALRTDDAALLRRAADAFGADYSVSTTDDGRTEVTHTGFLYAVDRAGRLRVQWAFGTSSETIAQDLSRLLDERADGAVTDAPTVGPTVQDAWVRATAAGQVNGAAYMVIRGGEVDDRLLAAAVPPHVAARAEIHETVAADGSGMSQGDTDGSMGGGMSGGMGAGHSGGSGGSGGSGAMTMREVQAIEVPAGAEVVLAPGGYHVMLMELVEPLEVGDQVELTLTFEQAGQLTLTADVRQP
ncbi:MAG TPA: copper chaperone PCu(A)C [Acidimicrobiales bacterium]